MKTLSMKVIQRFMNEKELEALLKDYEASKLTSGAGRTRFDSLNRTVTREEKQLLSAFCDATNTSRDLRSIFGVLRDKGNVRNRASAIALRMVFQGQTL